MTVDEFQAWASGRPGRYELFRGAAGTTQGETTLTGIGAEGTIALDPSGAELPITELYRD